jgi:hypothetical protein
MLLLYKQEYTCPGKEVLSLNSDRLDNIIEIGNKNEMK